MKCMLCWYISLPSSSAGQRLRRARCKKRVSGGIKYTCAALASVVMTHCWRAAPFGIARCVRLKKCSRAPQSRGVHTNVSRLSRCCTLASFSNEPTKVLCCEQILFSACNKKRNFCNKHRRCFYDLYRV
jgi:hypothetical protein